MNTERPSTVTSDVGNIILTIDDTHATPNQASGGTSAFLLSARPLTTNPLVFWRALLDIHELPRVFAYCQLDAAAWQKTGWIGHLIVDRPARRCGIGSAMITAAKTWAKQLELKRLMIAVQTKNYPGISFCEKQGFVFCGFNDHYFLNRDIALFFSLKI